MLRIAQTLVGMILLSVVCVAYGWTFRDRVIRGEVARHALKLVVLGLTVIVVVQAGAVAKPWSTICYGVLIAAILMPAGFLRSVLSWNPSWPSGLIALVWAGVAVVGVSLL